MGKKWDYDVPSVEIWQECLRVLKPGGHLLAFAGSRTYHRMAVRIEDAGFDIRDQIMWIYGSGFPKSHNVGKSIDKMQGNQRQVVAEEKGTYKLDNAIKNAAVYGKQNQKMTDDGYEIKTITKGNSVGEGWGTALKPAHEPIVMARKPIEGTVAENTLQYGVGGLNIDGTRIGNEVRTTPIHSTDKKEDNTLFGLHATIQHHREETTQGRWPANVILDEEAGQILDEQSGKSSSKKRTNFKKDNTIWQENTGETDTMSGGFNDEGGASRFFYCPKASKKDRDEGNIHPTVKPTDLMKYLIRLVTPKDGIVLDPFMGSGSTGKAAMQEGMWFVGIEREKEYFEIAKQRIEYEADKRKFW
jgi:site-specific DNA-methyltransferase (adenine-specific)